MSEKTLKFDNIRVNKKEFNKSKQPIDLGLVNVDQIVVSDKFKHSDDGFKYFIGYKEGEIIKPLCIILPQDSVLDKHNEIWDKIKETLNIKFHSMFVYDEKYINVKVRVFNGTIKTNFLGDKIPKESMHYTGVACMTIDSVMRMEKKIILRFI